MMRQGENGGQIFSATYSNVPVYEYSHNGNHVMRRRHDNWINATHILKVADFDKPARTRILEREVQKGVHEKVQGGYGKYQGTWVPLSDGRELAERNGVLDRLLPIFDFVPGDVSPPQAPKHTTAASNKPKIPKVAHAPRRLTKPVPAPSLISEDQYSNISAQLNDDDTPDNTTIASYEDQDDYLQMSQHSTGSRKRKRDIADQAARNTFADQEHRLYADELLDYFMMGGTDDPNLLLPDPPKSFIVNKPIDDFGYTALHWAAAMGDVDVCKDLINRGASPTARSDRHETPLIRAVMFTNNFEKQTMPKLINLLKDTIEMADACGSNVFHHITATTSSRNKNLSARYYLDTIINKLSESVSSEELSRVLDARDSEGDTALHIAARNGSKKCVRSLIGHNASSNIPNHRGELAEHLIATISARPKERFLGPSSSPFQHPMRAEIDEVAVQGLSLSNGASQSALSMTQTIVPLILEKTESFNEACANELKEKEEALAEGQRSFRALSTQLQETVRAVYDLATVEHDEAANRNDRDQVAMLVAENESLLEQVQCQEVPKSCLLEESKLSPTQLQQSLQPDQKELWAKVESARYLAKLQKERRALIKDAVQRMSMTGADERQALYRKLLSKTMNVPEDEVPNMVPDIMSWLKDDGGDDIMNEMPMLMGH